jgi:type IVB pilus formation R64 PilN family outer membrane protein
LKKKEVRKMKLIINLKKAIALLYVALLSFTIISCSNYSPSDVEKHINKIKSSQLSHKKIKTNLIEMPKIEHEVELFDKKVSATFFNESLKIILPTLVSKVQYDVGVDKNTLVSLETTGVKVGNALHKILKPIGLTYVRTTGGIIVTKQKRLTFKAFNQPLDIVLNAMLGDISFSVKDGASNNIKNKVSVDFKDLPIEMALDRILSQVGLQWKKESKSYVIFRDKEQLFSVNFPLLQQTFSVNSSRNNNPIDSDNSGAISTSSSNLVSSGTSASLSNLTETIEKFLTKDGKVVIHKEMGMIWIKDIASVVDRVGGFLSKINENLSKSVSISGVITEVELTNKSKTGIDWSSIADSLTRFGASVGRSGGAGANFTLGWKGNSGLQTKVYLDALKTFGDVNVVSRPSLRVANNAIGSLIVGKNTSYIASIEGIASASNNTTFASKLGSLQTGLNFYVLPHIISKTEAILYISPELTSLQSLETVSGGNGIQAPTISMRQAQTIVPIRNGESLVIGGLMSETENSVRGKTPIIGNIPLLGMAFQKEDSASGVSEFSLMVKVTW